MTPASLLLKVYYERLYDRMEKRRSRLLQRMDGLLAAEIESRPFAVTDPERLAAYRETCIAFLDERLETYNPVGIQYTFGNAPSELASELEFQLDWYDSKPEFTGLVAIARNLAEDGISDDTRATCADELIRRAGAFPDRSIIDAYEAGPALLKLPDYVVARAIEEIVCDRDPTP
jgi:hypothetical protein